MCTDSLALQALPVPEEEKVAVEKCTDRLQRIFMWYCSFSESANENKMPLSKFVLFVKDAGALFDSPEDEKTKCNFFVISRKGKRKIIIDINEINKLSITETELIFSKVIGILNDPGKRLEIPKEGCATPMKNEKVQKLYFETENNKRAKMDFKAFYYAVTMIAEKVYPELTPNKALIEFTEKVLFLRQ